VSVDLHLTEDTQLRTRSYIADGTLFAELWWKRPIPDSRLGQGSLWGTPAAMRRLAELILEAARLAEEEACWHAHTATTAATTGSRVA
jgi:hypothetical protein